MRKCWLCCLWHHQCSNGNDDDDAIHIALSQQQQQQQCSNNSNLLTKIIVRCHSSAITQQYEKVASLLDKFTRHQYIPYKKPMVHCHCHHKKIYHEMRGCARGAVTPIIKLATICALLSVTTLTTRDHA